MKNTITYRQRDAIIDAEETILRLLRIVITETEETKLKQRVIRQSLDNVARLHQIVTGAEELPFSVYFLEWLLPYIEEEEK